MKTAKLPDQLAAAKERLKQEIQGIHKSRHTIKDFDAFCKHVRLDLASIINKLEAANKKLVFKVGDVTVETDSENGKKFLSGSAYVGVRETKQSTLMVRISFTLANEKAGDA